MANHCWNTVIISEFKKEDRSKIVDFFSQDNYEKYTYFKHWCESILSDENKIDTSEMEDFWAHYAYGTKWWDIDYERLKDESTEEEILVSGDTAWSPPSAFLRALSEEFDCKIEIEYEEEGCDFGGHVIYQSGGEEELCNGTAREYRVYSSGVSEAIQRDKEWIEDIDDAKSIKNEYLGMDYLSKDDRIFVEKEFKELIENLKGAEV